MHEHEERQILYAINGVKTAVQALACRLDTIIQLLTPREPLNIVIPVGTPTEQPTKEK